MARKKLKLVLDKNKTTRRDYIRLQDSIHSGNKINDRSSLNPGASRNFKVTICTSHCRTGQRRMLHHKRTYHSKRWHILRGDNVQALNRGEELLMFFSCFFSQIIAFQFRCSTTNNTNSILKIIIAIIHNILMPHSSFR